MTSPQPPSPSAPGIEAFEGLRAEHEPWLAGCYLPPAAIERLASDRSMIVFGAPGSGKTALYTMLKTLAAQDEEPRRLVVDWRPAPLTPGAAADSAWVRRQAASALEACALTLAAYLAHSPHIFEIAPAWAQPRLIWFIRSCIPGDLALRLGPLIAASAPAGAALLQSFVAADTPNLLYDPSPDQILSEALAGLQQIGIAAVWFLSDGLEGWGASDPVRLSDSITAFLSCLTLLERPNLAFKLFLPAHIENLVMHASGVARRRVDVYHLRWTPAELQKIVELRLAFALDRPQFSLPDLCPAPEFPAWLQRAGGQSPREWLDQTLPLLRRYVEDNAFQPVSHQEWKQVLFLHPPHFWIDDQARRVRVGGREIALDDISPKAYDILYYLYERSGSVISKDELYYRAYLGLERLPRSSAERDYAAPKDYLGLIDTNLYRIRQAIEPDPSFPVLLQTVRGHGVRLVSRW